MLPPLTQYILFARTLKSPCLVNPCWMFSTPSADLYQQCPRPTRLRIINLAVIVPPALVNRSIAFGVSAGGGSLLKKKNPPFFATDPKLQPGGSFAHFGVCL